MNRTVCFAMLTFTTIAAPALATPGDAQRPTNHRSLYVYDIGSLENAPTRGTAINDKGQIVGWSGARAFMTAANGRSIRSIDTFGGSYSEAYGINNLGQVVGEWQPAPLVASRGFITGPDGVGMQEISTPVESIRVYVSGINDRGQVVGTYDLPNYSVPYITNGVTADALPIEGLGVQGQFGVAINNIGQVVGSAVFGADTVSFVTGAGGVGATIIATEAGSSVAAADINDAGQVSGYVDFPSGARAFVTERGSNKVRVFGTLHGTDTVSLGRALDDKGRSVGSSTTSKNPKSTRGVIIGKGGWMLDVNKLAVNLPKGVILTKVVAVNRNEQMVAIGDDDRTYIVCARKRCGEKQ